MPQRSASIIVILAVSISLITVFSPSRADIRVEKWKSNGKGGFLRTGQLEIVYSKAEVDDLYDYARKHTFFYNSETKRFRSVRGQFRKVDNEFEKHRVELATTKKEILTAINNVLGKRLEKKEQRQLRDALREELVKEINVKVVPRIREEVKRDLLTDKTFLDELANRISPE